MAGEIGSAVLGNAVTGASAGAPLGGWGMAAGAGIGAITGLLQGQRAKKLERDYQAAEKAIQPIDPAQMAYLNRVRQQERNFRAGTDPSSAFATMNARNVGGQTMANINRAGGAGVVGNLLRAQSGTNQAIAGIGANAAGQANQLFMAQGGLINRMADRVYERQVELRNQALERSVSARQNIQNTFQGALAMVPGIAGGLKLGQKPGQPAAPSMANGGLIGNQYVPSVQTGIGYQGLPTAAPSNPNYGFNYQAPRPNYGPPVASGQAPVSDYDMMMRRMNANLTPGTYRFANQAEADAQMGITR